MLRRIWQTSLIKAKIIYLFCKKAPSLMFDRFLNTALLARIYLFRVNNRNTRKWCEICSKLTIKTTERRQRCRSGVFLVSFEHILHLFLMFLLLNLNKQMLAGLICA